MINKIVAIVFIAIAAVQFNDPDPLYWIVVYAGTAWVAATAGSRFDRQATTLVVLGMAVAGLLIAAPGFVAYLASGAPLTIANGMDEQPYVEPAREFLGLLLALAALLWYARRPGVHAGAAAPATGRSG